MTEDRAAQTPEFETGVRDWLEANAPKKGDPADFSAVHLVSASTPEIQRNTIARQGPGLPREPTPWS
jgi:hypothetical protein